MQQSRQGADLLFFDHDPRERRQKPRINMPFIAKVQGVDISGKEFGVYTLLDNISATGLYMKLSREVESGSKLFSIVRLATYWTEQEPVARIAVRGVVLRVEPEEFGLCGIALRFTRHRFL
jgi:hypothetical protein